MLKKLFKHELAATGRYLIPLYLVLLVISLFSRLVFNLDIFHGVLAVIPGFLATAFVVSIIAVIVVTFVLMVMRFYKNLMGDEGYLMFTLPVKPEQLLNTKLISFMLWGFLSIVVVFASLFVAFADGNTMLEIAEIFREAYDELYNAFGGNIIIVLIEVVILLILGIISNILMIYLSITVGQLFNGHRVLASFIAYLGIYTGTQLVMSILIALFGTIFRNFLDTVESIPQLALPIGIIVLAASSAVYYFSITHIFKNKLNLE